jgi:hypothetical protein
MPRCVHLLALKLEYIPGSQAKPRDRCPLLAAVIRLLLIEVCHDHSVIGEGFTELNMKRPWAVYMSLKSRAGGDG